jgi:glycosyltransferase involved in cell wall biosynthesis
MKILISESSTAMGGQELAVLLHAEGLSKRGHELRVIVEPNSPIAQLAKRKGLPIEAVSMRRMQYPTAVAAFRRLIVRHRPDVLHVNSSRDSWIGSIAARLVHPRPTVIRSRHISTPLNRNVTTWLLYRRLVDGVIVTGGELTRRGLLERDGLAPDRVIAFPVGIDVDEFRPAPPSHPLRGELHLPPDHRLVGLISYLRAYKGHDYFIKAAAAVLREVKDVTFIIVGEGPEEVTIRSWIAEAALGEHVRISTGPAQCVPLAGRLRHAVGRGRYDPSGTDAGHGGRIAGHFDYGRVHPGCDPSGTDRLGRAATRCDGSGRRDHQDAV